MTTIGRIHGKSKYFGSQVIEKEFVEILTEPGPTTVLAQRIQELSDEIDELERQLNKRMTAASDDADSSNPRLDERWFRAVDYENNFGNFFKIDLRTESAV